MDWIVSYRIDRDDRICAVSDAWVAFALANSGQQLLPPSILGRDLWSMLGDPTTRQVYQALLGKVRAGTGPVRFQFRCDAPGERRLLSMHITLHDEGQVQFETAVVRDQPRVPVSLLDPSMARSEALLRICAWCMRIPVADGRWVELEDGIREMGLFDQPSLPSLTHGMCPSCFHRVMGALDTGPSDDAPVILGGLP